MPYIKSKLHRQILDRVVYNWIKLWKTTGHLNYFLFKLAKETCESYEDFRNLEGEVQQSLKEIYRRLEIPVEDDAIKRNGDVE